jgi:Xaa-Pro aminopeptidase
MDLERIQEALRRLGLDGWLFFDHHLRDPLAYRILQLDEQHSPTRRWYYLIPANGEPRGMVHRIEPGMLDRLPGEKAPYSSWTTQSDGLKLMLAGCHRVAMQYSPRCAIPYVAMVDAGTLELVRDCGVEVVSSADLVQQFEACWNPAKLEAHLEAGRRVDRIRGEAFALVGARLANGAAISELEVKQFILERFAAASLFTDHGPIVAVNGNASNPHYEPDAAHNCPIRPGDLLLIDMWAKLNASDGVYYDITWTGYCGAAPPEKMLAVFGIVTQARDKAVECVVDAIASGRELRGFEVDDVARGYIRQAGYGESFFHRTGHSIGADVHGAGANMDNLETHDERRVIPWTCFSIEPGIYLADFGIRSEVNVFVGEDKAMVTGEVQRDLLRL